MLAVEEKSLRSGGKDFLRRKSKVVGKRIRIAGRSPSASDSQDLIEQQ